MDEAELKSLIRSILISAGKPLTIEELIKDYTSLNGSTIPFGDFGYPNIYRLLDTFTDVLYIEGHGRGALIHPKINKATRHVSQLVQSQKNHSGGNNNRNNRRRQHPQQPPQTAQNNRRRNEKSNYFINFAGPPPMPTEKVNDEWDPPTTAKIPQNLVAQESEPSKVFVKNESTSEKEMKRKDVQPPAVKLPAKLKLEEDTSPKVTNENIPLSSSSIKSEETNSDAIVSMTSRMSLKEILKNKNYRRKTIEEKLKETTQKYKTEEDEWNPQEGTKRYLPYAMFKTKNQRPADIQKEAEKEEEVVKLDLSLFQNMLHDNCVRDSSEIQIEDGFNIFIQNDFVPIRVVEFYHPYIFWFNLNQNEEKLRHLQLELNEFYSSIDEHDYEFVPKANDFCALRYKSTWYRGCISHLGSEHTEKKIKVCLIDYGCVVKVNPRFVKALLKRFSRLPRQSLRGRLASVKPVGLKWNLEATNLFKKLVDDRIIMACSEKVNCFDQVQILTLIDTTNDNDINIAQAMIDANVAEACAVEGDTKNPALKFPSFKMIESGVFSKIVD